MVTPEQMERLRTIAAQIEAAKTHYHADDHTSTEYARDIAALTAAIALIERIHSGDMVLVERGVADELAGIVQERIDDLDERAQDFAEVAARVDTAARILNVAHSLHTKAETIRALLTHLRQSTPAKPHEG